MAHDAAPAAAAPPAVALDPGLGPLHHPVSTRNTKAQAYFDQGMKLVFAFNHEAAIQSFERAAQLDPASARAWAGIGATYIVSSGDFKAGIAALEKSLSLGAAQDDVAFNLVQLYARAGRREDAQRIVDSVLSKSSDPELIRRAHDAVVFADVKRAEDLLNTGKREEAAALAKHALSETTNDAAKEYLNRLITAADEQAGRAKQIDTINAAIRQANVHNYDDALKILDGLLPQITDADLKGRVEKLRTDIAAKRNR